MYILQSGPDVFGIDPAKRRFVKLPLTYTQFPTLPTAESYNEAVKWLETTLASFNAGLKVRLDPQQNLHYPGGTLEAEILNAGGTLIHQLGLELICENITRGTTASLTTTLKQELRAKGVIIA